MIACEQPVAGMEGLFFCLAMVMQIMRLGLMPVMHACDAQL